VTQSAVAFKESSNGREQKTDGLWTHLGQLDGGMLRARDNVAPRVGAGLELVYDRPSQTSYVQSLDRDAGVYRDLFINAKNLTLGVNGGVLSLPAGSITTPMLAANAAQQLIGSYIGVPNWSSTTTSTWLLTPIATGPVACGGGLLRCETSFIVQHSVASGYFVSGLGWDGAVQVVMSATHAPGVNYQVTISYVYYVSGLSGSHNFQIFIAHYTAGTLSLPNISAFSTLYVTEQKR
jgi:hypothetical protein